MSTESKGKVVVNKSKTRIELDRDSIDIVSDVEIYGITDNGKSRLTRIIAKTLIDEYIISRVSSETLKKLIEVVKQIQSEVLDSIVDDIAKTLNAGTELNIELGDTVNLEWVIIDIKPKRQ
jgi:hypothetical protein